MKVQDICSLVWSQTEENSTTYPPDLLIKYINLALDDLTQVAKMLDCEANIPLVISDGKATVVVHDGVPLDVAHEIVNVYYTPSGGVEERLRKLPPGDMISRGWIQVADEIWLRNLGPATSGVARVEFYRRLAHVVDTDSVPELPEEYHALLVLYCCAKIQEREAQVAFKSDFVSEYFVARQQFAMQRIWEMEPQHRNIIRQARVLGLLGVKSGR